MKDLKDIVLEKININEKLIINKNTKIRNIFVDTILSIIYSEPEDVDKKEKKVIEDWVKEKKVENLTIITRSDILKKCGIIDFIVQVYDFKDKFETDDIKIKNVDDSTYYEVERYTHENNYEVYKDRNCKIYRNYDINVLSYFFSAIGYIFFFGNNEDTNI